MGLLSDSFLFVPLFLPLPLFHTIFFLFYESFYHAFRRNLSALYLLIRLYSSFLRTFHPLAFLRLPTFLLTYSSLSLLLSSKGQGARLRLTPHFSTFDLSLFEIPDKEASPTPPPTNHSLFFQ